MTPEEVQKCVQNKQEGLFNRKKAEVDQTKYYNAEQKMWEKLCNKRPKGCTGIRHTYIAHTSIMCIFNTCIIAFFQMQN